MKKHVLQRAPSLFNFCGNTDVVLFLLQKELKGIRLSQIGHPLGIQAEIFYPSLGTLILSQMGLPSRSEAFMEWYERKLQKWSTKLDLESKSAQAELTLDFYTYLKKQGKRKNGLN